MKMTMIDLWLTTHRFKKVGDISRDEKRWVCSAIKDEIGYVLHFNDAGTVTTFKEKLPQ